MLTYVQLRNKLQLTTLALTELASEKSQDLKKKYIKFFLCQPPESHGYDDISKGSYLHLNSFLSFIKGQETKRNLSQIFRYNLEEIEVTGNI
jgi:hypothetical protein